MLNKFFIVILLLSGSGVALADTDTGTVTAITNDTITVRCERRTVTCRASYELLTNAGSDLAGRTSFAKFIEVKRGDKVNINLGMEGTEVVCVCIRLERPDYAGIVTEVGKDTITIRNDQGKTTTYRLTKELVDGTRPNGNAAGTNLYPSRFADVTKGCKIEVRCWQEGGVTVICGIDIKEKAKEE
jgi:preprotein translocase subunit YajC